MNVLNAPDKLKTNLSTYFSPIDFSADNAPSLKDIIDDAQLAAQALGYYHATFEATLAGKTLHLNVVAGERMAWSAPALTINHIALDSPSASNLPQALRPPPHLMANTAQGMPVDHNAYDTLKKEWLEKVIALGYLDAKFTTHTLKVSLKNHSAQATLHLNSGEQYTISSITFSGSSLNDELLYRLSPLVIHQPIKQRDMLLFRRNLENSQYFSSVVINTDRNTDHTIDIHVSLKDTANHHISVGAGYGTDTGVRGRLRLENPQINTYGHRLVNELQVSEIKQELSSTYTVPLERPLEKKLIFTASGTYQIVENTRNSVARLGSFLSDLWRDNWRASYGANFFYEKDEIGDEPANFTRYATPSITLNRTAHPLVIDPLNGSNTLLHAEGSNTALGADTHFLRLQAGYKYLFPLYGTQTLLTRVEVGVVLTDSIFDVPLSQRFFTGGDQSVRGYAYNVLAPRNEDGELEGGQYLNILSVEYSELIFDSWRIATFVDAGRAFNTSDTPWNVGAGIGVRWLSPIGRVKIDLAVPVENTQEEGFQIHISMGGAL